MIDTILFLGFLIGNLVIGLRYGKGLRNISDYALGGRNFSTGAIAATLVATWIGGGFFAWNLSKAYTDGLPFMVAVMGNGIALGVLGYFYSPRMGEFLGCNSVAEAMGQLYGSKVRVITAISAICLAIGYTGLQIKLMANLLNWTLGVNGVYATIMATSVVVIYSTFGGIRSVTFTDVIQLLTFGAFVPGIAMLIWGSFDTPDLVIDTISNSNLMNYQSIFTLSWLVLFLWFTFPDLDPSLFQRVLIAKNVYQVRKAFMVASCGCVAIITITSLIGLLVFVKNPSLNPEQIVMYIMDHYSYPGVRGLTMAGISAMVMSTVDSYINSASVLFANDVCEGFGFKIRNKKTGLLVSRIFAASAGTIGLWIAMSENSLFDLTLIITNFYMPIVTAPLTLAIFGFRSTSKSVMIGMAAGVSTVFLWNHYMVDTEINSVVPGMLMNMIFLVSSHYLLQQPGGWVGIKAPEPLEMLRIERRNKFRNMLSLMREFSVKEFLHNSTPKQENSYVYFAIFSMVSIFSTFYTLPAEVKLQHTLLLDFIYHSVLVLFVVFLTYPIWPQTFKNDNLISIIWNIAIYYTLVCVSTLMICMSNFSQFQIMMFVLNLFVITSFVRNSVVFAMIVACSIATMKLYQIFSDDIVVNGVENLQFKIIYSLLLVSSVLIAFLRPQHQYQEVIEKKTNYLAETLKHQKKELVRLYDLKKEFLLNMEHETHAPITGIASMGQVLWEKYDNLTEEQRREGLKEIAKSSERLQSLVNNLTDLSKLDKMGHQINKELVDISALIVDRIEVCSKLFANELGHSDREFELKSTNDLLVPCDKHYMARVIDNIIINAMQYCPKGKILVKITADDGNLEISIKDQGVGIPKHELFDVFDPFSVSSRTKTPAGGRGVGLALCKKIIEAHGGSIWVENNIDVGSDNKGATFFISLPLATS